MLQSMFIAKLIAMHYHKTITELWVQSDHSPKK